MSGQWRPEWDDPEDEHTGAGLPELQPEDEYSELELSEVTSFLASVSGPALPAAFEARISAAIAAEAAARAAEASSDVTAVAAAAEAGPPAADTGADDAKDTVRSDNSKEFSPLAPASRAATPAILRPRRFAHASKFGTDSSGPGNSRPAGGRRRLRMPSLQTASWVLVACLFVGGFGFLVTRAGGSSSSSSEAASSAAVPAAGSSSQHNMTTGGASRKPQHTYSSASEPSATASASGLGPLDYVTSGTRYEQSTLARQVQDVLARVSAGSGEGAVTPGASSSASSSASSAGAPPLVGHQALPALEECVTQFTPSPTLVDKASYAGKPAYIIVGATEAWVVGPNCSGSDKDLIASVPLKG